MKPRSVSSCPECRQPARARRAAALGAALIGVAALAASAGCGGGGSGGVAVAVGGGASAAVQGIALPSQVSAVTAVQTQ